MANASNSSANRYKGNDIDSDGDGRVGKADHASNASNAQNVKGNDIDSDGDGRVDAADHADTAGDADTVDGQDASDLGGEYQLLQSSRAYGDGDLGTTYLADHGQTYGQSWITVESGIGDTTEWSAIRFVAKVDHQSNSSRGLERIRITDSAGNTTQFGPYPNDENFIDDTSKFVSREFTNTGNATGIDSIEFYMNSGDASTKIAIAEVAVF
jgi:hypothetical protein